ILDLYAARYYASFKNTVTPKYIPAVIAQEMQKMVPFEFFKGQKFDINRWLGNGLDTADVSGYYNGARDNPTEAANEYAWQGTNLTTLPSTFSTVQAQHTNTVDVANPSKPADIVNGGNPATT